MSSDLSKYVGNKFVRWLGGQTMPAAPTLWMALFQGDPKTGGTEKSTTINAGGRQPVTWAVPASNDTDNILTNSAAVDWGASAGDATIDYSAIFDASTGGKRISSKALPGGAVNVVTTQPVSFGVGDVKFEIGG